VVEGLRVFHHVDHSFPSLHIEHQFLEAVADLVKVAKADLPRLD
jgi:hypothetical protein